MNFNKYFLSEVLVFQLICSVEWNFVCIYVCFNPPYIQAILTWMFQGEGERGCLPDTFLSVD